LAYSLIRVLDDDGQAQGPSSMQTDPELLCKGLQFVIKTRYIAA